MTLLPRRLVRPPEQCRTVATFQEPDHYDWIGDRLAVVPGRKIEQRQAAGTGWIWFGRVWFWRSWR